MSKHFSYRVGVIGLLVCVSLACSTVTRLFEPGGFEPEAIRPHFGPAPDFSLRDSQGNTVRLADELPAHRSVVLVFYYAYT